MKKRKILALFTSILCFTGPVVTFAQTNTNALQNIQTVIQQKAQEKQSVNNEIQSIQQEISSLNTYITDNQKSMETTQQRIAAANQLIETKREEIVKLENKILARKNVMKERLIALQHDDSVSLIIKVFLDSKSLDDLLQRASAVTTLFNADNDILQAQQNDLQQIQKDKNEIDNQEKTLESEQNSLAKQQENLNLNLQKRQATLTDLQNKINQIDKQMTLAQQQKASIAAQIQAAQVSLRQEQAAASANSVLAPPQSVSTAAPVKANGQEIYVTATAYSPQDSGSITSLGYNIKSNPNMKLIAVDPSVIPLGKKVWVEGYGVAIAGDTGGAIQGYRIDVLMPTVSACTAWGVRTVKVIVLN